MGLTSPSYFPLIFFFSVNILAFSFPCPFLAAAPPRKALKQSPPNVSRAFPSSGKSQGSCCTNILLFAGRVGPSRRRKCLGGFGKPGAVINSLSAAEGPRFLPLRSPAPGRQAWGRVGGGWAWPCHLPQGQPWPSQWHSHLSNRPSAPDPSLNAPLPWSLPCSRTFRGCPLTTRYKPSCPQGYWFQNRGPEMRGLASPL